MPHVNSTESELSVSELHTARAHIYQWFSQQFLTELSEEQWQVLTQGQLAPFFELLAENGLESEVNGYTQAIQQLADQYGDQARIRLASDFAHAFLLSGRDSALPYASAYEANADGQLYGVATQVMKQFLREADLSVTTDFNEPEDHLAIYLAVLSTMAANFTASQAAEQLQQQADFLEQALLPWLTPFVAAIPQDSLHSAVYPRLAQLLLAYVQQDQQFLTAQRLQVAASE